MSLRASRARSAFSVTRIDDPDIASAAISGVTKPSTAGFIVAPETGCVW